MSIEEMGYFTDRAVRSDRIIYTPTPFCKRSTVIFARGWFAAGIEATSKS